MLKRNEFGKENVFFLALKSIVEKKFSSFKRKLFFKMFLRVKRKRVTKNFIRIISLCKEMFRNWLCQRERDKVQIVLKKLFICMKIDSVQFGKNFDCM